LDDCILNSPHDPLQPMIGTVVTCEPFRRRSTGWVCLYRRAIHIVHEISFEKVLTWLFRPQSFS
jgi:hypothetical protein